MYALKEHVHVEFEVKVEAKTSPRKKTRQRGTTGRTNKSATGAEPKEGSSSSRVEESKGAGEARSSSSRENTKAEVQKKSMNAKESPPSLQQEVDKKSSDKGRAKSASKPLPNRPRSAANPSKRYSPAHAMQLKQEPSWNYDLTLADRDILTMERDAQIASKKATREHLEKRRGNRVAVNNSSRVRAVKAVSGTALNGKSKTIFALVHQRQQEALNKTVSGSSRKEGSPNDSAPIMSMIDKYTVSRDETGIHADPWNNSELLAERLDKELRLVPNRPSRLVPMTAADMHKDVSYKNISALNAGESVADNAVDDFGKRRVKAGANVTRLKEGSISDMGAY